MIPTMKKARTNMNKATQCERIIKWMQEHGEVTQRDAFLFLGCQRLASRIHDLKRQGHQIKTETREVTNSDGSKTHIAVYSLQEEVQDNG